MVKAIHRSVDVTAAEALIVKGLIGRSELDRKSVV